MSSESSTKSFKDIVSFILPEMGSHFYQFLVTAIINYNKLSGSKQQKCIFFMVLKAISLISVFFSQNQKAKCWQSYAPSGGPRVESIPCFFQLLVASGILCLVVTSLPSLPPLHMAFSSPVSHLLPLSSCKDACDDIRTYPGPG